MRGLIDKLPVLLICAVVFTGCGNKSHSGKQQEYVLSDTIGKAVITFSSFEHDFGKIKEGEKVGCVFSFTNSGDADLIVTSVLTSCGCTVTKYDKKPIPPGGKGTVEVVYDSSDRSGLQTKTITVQSNAEKKIIILRITADVINKNK